MRPYIKEIADQIVALDDYLLRLQVDDGTRVETVRMLAERLIARIEV
jgi:hypothetical protein